MSMKYESFQKYTGVTVQPAVRLVALFEEAVEYDRHYLLPFHTLELCARDDPSNPTWFEIGGKREIFPLGQVRFIAAMTPMHIRCTTAFHKLAIHFRCELRTETAFSKNAKDWIAGASGLPSGCELVIENNDHDLVLRSPSKTAGESRRRRRLKKASWGRTTATA